MAVLTPMPSASDRMAIAANPGLRRRTRTAYARSLISREVGRKCAAAGWRPWLLAPGCLERVPFRRQRPDRLPPVSLRRSCGPLRNDALNDEFVEVRAQRSAVIGRDSRAHPEPLRHRPGGVEIAGPACRARKPVARGGRHQPALLLRFHAVDH